MWHCCIDVSLFSLYSDFVLSNWKTERGLTTLTESSIALLEDDLEMFGHLHKPADVCNRTTGSFTSPATGWTNGKPNERQ